jgi:hypothetical protein
MKNKKLLYMIIPIIIGMMTIPIILISCKKSGNTTDPGGNPQSNATPPAVSGYTVTSIGTVTATCGGNITSDGGAPVTDRGVCWSTTQTPLTTDFKTSSGTGTGSFTSGLTGLFPGTTYTVRAFATNSAGTSYGIPIVFTTNYVPLAAAYFPIAVWDQDPTKNAIGYTSIGINIFVGLWNALDATLWSAIKGAGLKLICAQNSYALSLGADPSLVGYNMEDEPDNAQANGSGGYNPCIAPSYIINEYQTLKQNDPSRLVYLSLGQGVAYNNYIGRGTCRNNLDTYKVSTNGYLVGCDMCSFDIYPVNNTDGITNGKLEYVAMGVQNLIAWSGNKPAWCWIESTRIEDTSPRRPTTSEVKSEVWMALIHGAKGFGYFCHSFVTGATDEAAMLHDAEMSNAIKAINAQVTYLAVVLNSATTIGYATVSSDNGSVPVDIMAKNYGGANYIFAIAMSNGQANASFTVTSGTSAEVMGEGRAIPITNGKFSDLFLPYAVHLYKITN